MSPSRRNAPSLPLGLILAVLCIASAVCSASIDAARMDLHQPPSSVLTRSQSNLGTADRLFLPRHGDNEEEHDAEDEEHGHDLHHEMAESMQNMEMTDDSHEHEHEHEHKHKHNHNPEQEHNHETSHSATLGHSHHDMAATGLSPSSIPDATIAGSELLELPIWHAHRGHSHSHTGPVLEELNETLLFRAHGPDPLSYIEWDFGYALGSVAELRRFTSDTDVLAGKPKMGVVDKRWRKFLDEKDAEQRQAIAADIAARLSASQGDGPSRHRGLLMLHVVTAVISCFLLLPMALVLRAAHSSLAPFVSLLYLVLLGGSMLVSIAYKALTPRLYPENAHGSMGWAILCISLITLGSDVFRLLVQIRSTITSLTSSKQSSSNVWLPTDIGETNGVHRSWKDVGATLLGRQQHRMPNSESYDALEEEAMLSTEGGAQSDSLNFDLEKHLQHRLSSRRSQSNSRTGSGSGSPHHVHFDDRADGAHSRRTLGSSVESLAEPVPWVGSGSTVVSCNDEQHRHGTQAAYGNVMVASPTTTVCNTPRNSMIGGESALLSPLNLKPISPWNIQTHQAQKPSLRDAPNDMLAAAYSPTKARSSRLDIFRTIVRYTRVVAARSLPVLAFATSYTGLAVYTGSCRGGYKNVCLAHGIKGGIFFWFGLLTFGRYLGAYADCGWAWNKRPSVQAARSTSRSQSAWRRSMPSAEFVECLVIFIYGVSNTWMERFGAAPGDPYTIKQIQHISIAVMFWFAGLMGMLLETKWIRNMLSFPIAYNHVAAVPLREVRHRYRHSTGTRNEGADADLDLLLDAQTQPASYSASFNPFPALVIGITGVAMAAHHQDYQYEVAIHMLWGQLLAGFALLRCLTYFLLWLRPPTASVLPSRPPTEALAAFSLCCGGLVFMLSSEEVSFAAMRSGYGDFMAILNVAVAVVALLFCWTTVLMMLKGWAVRREVKRTTEEQQDEQFVSEERAPRHMRAKAVSKHDEPVAEAEAVFVLDDDDDVDNKDDSEQASVGRHISV